MYRALTLTLFILSAMLTTSCGLKKTASEFLPRKGYVYVQKTVKLRKCLDDKCIEGGFTASGSGFIVKITYEGSYVMTASHVCVEDKSQYIGGVEVAAESVLVETLDGRTYTAKVLDHDPDIDVCLMFAENLTSKVKAVRIADSPPKEGDKVFNIASPYGIHYNNVVPIFEGRYIGIKGKQSYYTFDAAPGSSGSMIINDKGELIGLLHSVFIKMNVVVVSVTYDDLRAFARKVIINHQKDRYKKILLMDDKLKL